MKHWLSLLLFTLLGMAGCASPIVGAQCKPGLSVCSATCVDLKADFRNCGACGHECGRYLCEVGVCSHDLRPDAGGPIGDGGLGDAADGSGFGYDGGSLDGGPIGAGRTDAGKFVVDAGLGGCSLGEQECGASCVNPSNDPGNCGTCGHVCPVGQVCSAGGNCSVACDANLTLCGGRCLDLTSDPDHCGGCGTSCSSGICEGSSCADAVPGHVVVIGHDYLAANNTMRRIAGNAVFLARGAPVQVLVYTGEADPASVSGVEAAINYVQTQSGRAWKKTDAIEVIVTRQLLDADVFLIHAQANARKSPLGKLGQQWGNALRGFVAAGGVIVVFDAPSTVNDGTFRLLEPGLLFSAQKRETIANQQLQVVVPGIGVATQVSDRYMSARDTVRFVGLTLPGTVIVQDTSAQPVVVHRVIVH